MFGVKLVTRPVWLIVEVLSSPLWTISAMLARPDWVTVEVLRAPDWVTKAPSSEPVWSTVEVLPSPDWSIRARPVLTTPNGGRLMNPPVLAAAWRTVEV